MVSLENNQFIKKNLTMKKLLFAGMLLLSVAAIHASSKDATNKSGYGFAQSHWNNIKDTVPQDTTVTDTTTTDEDVTDSTANLRY